MISTLTQKQQQLLKYLLRPGSLFTAEELAKRLDTSARTVVRYVNTINDNLQEYGLQVALKRGQGYGLEGNTEELRALLAGGQPEDSAWRVNQIILTLLYRDSVTIEQLSELLYMSVSALNKMTVTVREVLQNYDLALSGRPYYGLFIEGSEKDKRHRCSV